MQNSKSQIGLNYSVLALILFIVAFIVSLIPLNMKPEFLSIAIGITCFFSFVLAIIGGINSILGLREEASKEQIIGLIISSILLMLIIYITIQVFVGL